MTARWRGGSRRSLAGLGIRQVWLICHTVVERVGERRVTGRDLGEKAAAEATNKEATRMIPRRCESASHVGELASGKALSLAKFCNLGIFSAGVEAQRATCLARREHTLRAIIIAESKHRDLP